MKIDTFHRSAFAMAMISMLSHVKMFAHTAIAPDMVTSNPVKPPFRLRGKGRQYPHSSTRQRARYARQVAAGKLAMRIDPAPEAKAAAKPKRRARRAG
jgi:hypothetical protein